MKTNVVKAGDDYRVEFTQGVQGFTLRYSASKEECEWMEKQLNKAFQAFLGQEINKSSDRIFLLEAELQQAMHTIKFLHMCLTQPKHAKYAYPNQTIQELEFWEKILPKEVMCEDHVFLSVHKKNCLACVKARKHYLRHKKLRKIFEDYPFLDDIWPSRRWNKEHTDYIDLSGS